MNQRASKVNFIPKIKKKDLMGRVIAAIDKYNIIEIPPMTADKGEYSDISIRTRIKIFIITASLIIRFCFIVKGKDGVTTEILGCIVDILTNSF